MIVPHKQYANVFSLRYEKMTIAQLVPLLVISRKISRAFMKNTQTICLQAAAEWILCKKLEAD